MRSIRFYVFGLVAICLILAAAAFGFILVQADATSRDHAEGQSRETAKALSQAVDGELQRAMGILAALRASNAAMTQNWSRVDRTARMSLNTSNSWIVVQNRAGRQLVNTSLPAGAALPTAPPPAEMWKTIETGAPHICDISRGVVAQRIVCVDEALPVAHGEHLAISVIFKPEAFRTIVTREGAGAGNLATLVDRFGNVIWRNRKAESFIGHQAHGPMLRAIRSGVGNGVVQSVSLEGVPMLSAYNRSPLSGWTVIVGTPLESFQTSARRAMVRGALIAAGLLLIGGLLGALLAARLTAAVRALARTAERDGFDSEPTRTGVREIDSVADALAASFSAKTRSERHQQILIGELNHRVKNMLSVVQSLAHQTFKGDRSPAEAIAAFNLRLRALADAHNLLTSERWEAASMQQIISTAVAPFCQSGKCDVEGPDVRIAPETAVTIALAVHELATNASKYGALKVPGGRIAVTWTVAGDDFSFLWSESGGPPVEPPTREGFGMRLIKRSLAAELQGAVHTDFSASGFICRIDGKLRPVAQFDQSGAARSVMS